MHNSIHTKVNTLKNKLLHGCGVIESSHYFISEISMEQELHANSVPCTIYRLKVAVTQLLLEEFQKVPGAFMLHHIPEYDFVHGVCLVDRQLACTVFFYRDLGRGILTTTSYPSGKVDYFNFAAPEMKMVA